MSLTQWTFGSNGDTLYTVAASNDGEPEDAEHDPGGDLIVLWADDSNEQPVAVVRRGSGLTLADTGVAVAPAVRPLSNKTEWIVFQKGVFVAMVYAYSVAATGADGHLVFYRKALGAGASGGKTVAIFPLSPDLAVFRSEYLLDPAPTAYRGRRPKGHRPAG